MSKLDGAQRLRFAAQLELARLAEAEVARGLRRALRDEHLPGLGGLLEPRRRVDGIAGRERLAGTRRRDRHHRAGVDPDPQLERDAVALADLLVELAEAPAHAQCGAERARGIVLVHAAARRRPP